MRIHSIALLALLAACGPRVATDVIGTPLSPEQEECRAEARRSLEVRRVDREVNPQPSWLNTERTLEERRIAETRAWRECLRARGLAAPGGVEIIRPR